MRPVVEAVATRAPAPIITSEKLNRPMLRKIRVCRAARARRRSCATGAARRREQRDRQLADDGAPGDGQRGHAWSDTQSHSGAKGPAEPNILSRTK